MKTPITDHASDNTDAFESPMKAREFARRLETDRAALMEALESFLNPSHPNRNKQTLLAVALTAARANFPEQP